MSVSKRSIEQHRYRIKKKLEIDKPDSCLKTFKYNNRIGLLIFLNLIMGKLLVIS